MSEGKPKSFEELLGEVQPEPRASTSPKAAEPKELIAGKRQCYVCRSFKTDDPEFFPYANGAPLRGRAGNVCLQCRDDQQKRMYADVAKNAMRIAREARAEKVPPTTAAGKNYQVKQMLRRSAATLNVLAEPVLNRLIAILADPTHPKHDEMFQFVLERAMPLKLVTEIGLADAGLSDKATDPAAKPTVVFALTVNGVPVASGQSFPALPARAGEVIDITPALEERASDETK